MTVYNRTFAKLVAGSLSYGPVPLACIRHRHEEEDVPALDPETGEPTGETERIVHDWDENVTCFFPTAADYAAAGFLPVVDEPPGDPPQEGTHWEPSGWEERDGAVRRVYAQVQDPPPPPRTFSKLRCVSALMAAGVWPQVKGYITEAGLYDLFLAAQDFREDNAYFADGRSRLQTALGWSDEQVEAVLAASVAGEA